MRSRTGMLLAAIMATIALMPVMASAQDNQETDGRPAVCRGNAATITGAAAGGSGATILGTHGDDVIIGTDGPDRIDGRGGNDIICGLGGDDIIMGSAGNDVVVGGPGDDTLAGGAQRDLLAGNGGHDRIDGDGGRDRIRGGPGDDILRGGTGRDLVVGNGGNDSCEPSRGRAIACEGAIVVTASEPVGNGPEAPSPVVTRRPGARPDVPVAPSGVTARVVGACRTIAGPAYPGENPWYSGGSFCSVEIRSTQVAPTLAGSDENVTVGFLCNAANPSIEDLKNPFACQLSTGGTGVSGIEDLSPRDRPGPVSGVVDYVRTGHRYCVHAGSVTYYDHDDTTGSSRWLPNTDVVGPRCFSLSGAGVLSWY